MKTPETTSLSRIDRREFITCCCRSSSKAGSRWSTRSGSRTMAPTDFPQQHKIILARRFLGQYLPGRLV